jgi:hypothetical protein
MNHRVSKMENGSLHPVPPPENPHRGVVLKATYRPRVAQRENLRRKQEEKRLKSIYFSQMKYIEAL